MIKVIFWDLSGTLVRPKYLNNAELMLECLTKSGVETSALTLGETVLFTSEYRKLYYDTTLTSLNAYEDRIKELVNKFYKSLNKSQYVSLVYHLVHDEERLIFEKNIYTFFSELEKQNIRQSIISNWQVTCPFLIEKFNLKKYVESPLISSFQGIEKPNRDLFLRGLKNFNVSPEETIMIGNSQKYDIDVPKSIGMHTILYSNRLDREEDLEKELLTLIENER